MGKAPDVMSALRKAKNKAANYLHYIERYDNHTGTTMICQEFGLNSLVLIDLPSPPDLLLLYISGSETKDTS